MGKRNKSYYKGHGSAKSYKVAELQQGAVGFMFSFVKDRERQAKAEAYELLNSYAQSILEKESKSNQDATSSTDGEGSDEDIEAAMARQVTKLKQKKPKESFLYHDPGVNQILFMKTTLNNHNSLTYKILEDARNGQLKCTSRVLHRMVPVLATCRAEAEKIGECVQRAIDLYLEQESIPSSVTYKSLVKVRNNNDKTLSQTILIKTIGEVVRDNFSEWKVNLTDPAICIVVDVLKKVCCVSVVHDYNLYRKFNLQELVANFHTSQALAASDSRVAESAVQSSNKATVRDNDIATEEIKTADNAVHDSSIVESEQPLHSGAELSETTKKEPVQSDALQTDAVKTDLAEADLALMDLVQSDDVQADAAQADPAQADPAQTGPAQTGPAQADPAPMDLVQAGAVQADAVQADSVKSDPALMDLVQSEPVLSNPVLMDLVQPDSVQTDPVQIDSVSSNTVELEPAQPGSVNIEPAIPKPVSSS